MKPNLDRCQDHCRCRPKSVSHVGPDQCLFHVALPNPGHQPPGSRLSSGAGPGRRATADPRGSLLLAARYRPPA
eukprot:9847843-Lingulodinium_polyedra.AAC.1